jgi:elongation factor Ts
MGITAADIKELREKTSAGIMDCKAALKEAKGDFDEAVKVLRKKGLSAAAKRAGREVKEGVIGSYIHSNGKIGVLVEINCETDFVARTDEFQEMVRNIAMHVAASDPRFVSREEVTEEILEQEREIYLGQAKASGKPENIALKIVEGKMNKYYGENCLLEQTYVKNQDMTIKDYIAEAVGKLGENITLSRFARFSLGENAKAESSSD